jgi:DNA-directed RNA polymerase specialized sigma24 family protein
MGFMTYSLPRRVRRAARHDVRTDDSSPFSLTTSNQASHKPIGIAVGVTPNFDGVLTEDPGQSRLAPEKLEAILAQEYRPLTPWVAKKLRVEYGVRDLPRPDLPGQRLQIVAPIADELVHDTIVDLWIKTTQKEIELKSKTDVRRWLKGALKISLRRWAQHEAREYEGRVYSVPIDDEQHDPMCGEVTEPWDTQNKGTLWRKIEEVFDRLDGDCPSTHQKKVPSDEVNAAVKHLPGDMQKLVDQVYMENMSWQEASASLNVERRILEREVQQWLHTLRPHILSYQPSRRPVREDTRRVRKSFHCPVCETKVKRKKGQYGAACTGCGIGIPKDQFAIKYSYRHA